MSTIKKKNKDAVKSQAALLPSWLHALALSAVVFIGTLTYSNSFNCSFHFDDKQNIVNNSHLRNVSADDPYFSLSQSRLIGNLSFAFNYSYNGLNVRGYHFFNLIVHLLNACLVYGLILLLFNTPELKKHPSFRHRAGIALFAALIFVVHPLATQSVTYIVQRLASMVTLFYLSTIFFYLKGRLTDTSTFKRVAYFLLAGFMAILAFLTKENSFTLPVALVLTEICFFQPQLVAIDRKNYRLLAVLGILVAVVGVAVARFSTDVLRPIPPSFGHAYTLTPATYLFTQFSVIVKYIQLLLVPVNQNLDYDFPLSYSLWEPRALISLVILLSLLVLAIRIFKNHRLAAFGILWFFLTLAIESSIVPISDVIFEHRTYLPSFGFLLAVVSLGYTFFWTRKATAAVITVVLVVITFSAMAYKRNKV
ncbi:MAG: hypothetical protein ACKOQ6_03850, partial [Bacteroidota bacterium]